MRVVLDMQDRRSIWAMPSWVPDRIRDALPPGWSLQVIEEPADGSGDGAARISPAVRAAVADAGAYLGFGIPEDVLVSGHRLVWVHTGSAGVGSSLTPELLRRRELVFTNSAGIHAAPMAETVLGMILHFTRGLDLALAGQARGEWVQERFWEPDAPLVELSSATVGIVGFGGIGSEVGRRVAAFGARVVGLVRRPRAGGVAELTAVGTGVRLGTAELVHGDYGLRRLLADADVAVLAAPDTPATRGMIDRAALAGMRKGAVLINVSRGKILDEDALVDALREGRIRGAGLDVFRSEPLPAGHALWTAPNVLLTPHVSAVTRAFWEREAELILANLASLAAGEPLRNVVDRAAGY
ncbi:MAG: D-2-hydroxyacid dehydrogenase [Gemmatimonadetes bacterium]|nr:D-2-hydroxyacid dehydrogenase [Gemmatimonadota bacterium]